MAGIFALLAFTGFIPTYFAKVADGTFAGAPALHIHGALCFTWTLFFFVQTVLVASGRTPDHRAWGMAGIALATAMAFTVVLAAINSMRVANAIGMVDEARRFSFVSLTGVTLFAGFLTLAIVFVKRSEIHKRLMLLTMIPLVHAAMGRVLLTLFAPPNVKGPPPVFVWGRAERLLSSFGTVGSLRPVPAAGQRRLPRLRSRGPGARRLR